VRFVQRQRDQGRAAFLRQQRPVRLNVMTVGRRGRDFVRRAGVNDHREWLDVFRNLDFSTAQVIADDLVARYIGGEIDAVYVAYNEFKSVVSQRPVVEQIPPIPGPS
jgi:F-type H+-transporting ATPase subunit gamma